MDNTTQKIFIDLKSSDDKIRLIALQSALNITENKVNWVYEVWGDLIDKLDNENSYQRSIGIMLLCNLAKSDAEKRIQKDLKTILKHTKDDKFITSRQCLQNIWKIASACIETKEPIIKHLKMRFTECSAEKHSNLLRLDIIQSIYKLYRVSGDKKLIEIMTNLIEEEKEEKYRKQYKASIAELVK